MSKQRWKPMDVVFLAVAVLILKITVSIVLEYRNYFPPNFDSMFLDGREGYFFGSYRWAFLTHIISAPVSMLLGTVLISERFRQWRLQWHRTLGRVQAINVICFVAPSGFWMAFYADAGSVAATGFGMLAILTGLTAVQGWRCAVQRRFANHRRWMWRNFALLSSAIVLRVLAGISIGFQFGPAWLDPALSWVSWLLPLAVLEACHHVRQRMFTGHPSQPDRQAWVHLQSSLPSPVTDRVGSE